MSERAPGTNSEPVTPNVEQMLAANEAAHQQIIQQAEAQRTAQVQEAWTGPLAAENATSRDQLNAERQTLESFQDYLNSRPTKDPRSTGEYAQLDYLKPLERNKRPENVWKAKSDEQLVSEYHSAVLHDNQTTSQKQDVLTEIQRRGNAFKNTEKGVEYLKAMDERLMPAIDKQAERKAKLETLRERKEAETAAKAARVSEAESAVAEAHDDTEASESSERTPDVTADTFHDSDAESTDSTEKKDEIPSDTIEAVEPIIPVAKVESAPKDASVEETESDTEEGEDAQDDAETQPVVESDDSESEDQTDDTELDDRPNEGEAGDDEEEYEIDVPEPARPAAEPKEDGWVTKKLKNGLINVKRFRPKAKGQYGRRDRITNKRKKAEEDLKAESLRIKAAEEAGYSEPFSGDTEVKQPGRAKRTVQKGVDKFNQVRDNRAERQAENEEDKAAAKARRDKYGRLAGGIATRALKVNDPLTQRIVAAQKNNSDRKDQVRAEDVRAIRIQRQDRLNNGMDVDEARDDLRRQRSGILRPTLSDLVPKSRKKLAEKVPFRAELDDAAEAIRLQQLSKMTAEQWKESRRDEAGIPVEDEKVNA